MIESGQDTSPKGTKDRILDAAEELFAEHGVAATSLRSVIAKAEVNLAAVHYHFGSKDDLLRAVAKRRLGPANQERLELLSRYEADAPDGVASLDQVVDAFVRPMMNMWQENRAFVTKLVGRLLGEPGFFEQVAPQVFHEMRSRFMAAFQRALPDVPEEEVFWRLMCCIGTMTYSLRVADHLPALSDGVCELPDAETAIARVTAFVKGGMMAAPSGGGKQARTVNE